MIKMSTAHPGEVPVLSCRDITKTYESNHVRACSGINLELHAGEIHCILGENGAGKSTLMRILTGDQIPDEGHVIFKGKEIELSSPHDALQRGIGMIHQQSNCIPELSVWENIILGAEHISLVSRLTMKGTVRQTIDSICRRCGLSLPYRKAASKLDSSGIQTTALVSLLHRDAKVLIFDEPHPLFSGDPPVAFTDLVRMFAREGMAVAVVTHNLTSAFSIASRITVLRRGASMGTFKPGEIDIRGASRLMMGVPMEQVPKKITGMKKRRPYRSPASREPLLTLEHLTTLGDEQDPSSLKDVSFSVYPGEILACIGIKEHGLTTLERLLSRYTPGESSSPPRITEGSIYFTGHKQGIPTLAQLRKMGVGYVPSNRLISGASVRGTMEENAILHVHRSLSKHVPGIIDSKESRSYTYALIRDLSIQGNPGDMMLSLSGGNIQKLIAARELALKPKLLIACEITWGLDIMTQEFLFSQVEALRKTGTAVLLITSETDIALKNSDRIAMFYRGRLAGIVDADTTAASDIGDVILGGAEA